MTKPSSVFADSKKHFKILDGLRGIAAIVELHFHVLCGVTTMSIYYFSKSNKKKVVEMMTFNEDLKVTKATVNYSS
jgi:hypothetical protein